MRHKPDFSSYTDQDWQQLSDLARQQTSLSGFYNDNYRLVHDGHAFLFRFPKKDEEQFDPKPFHEADVYRLLEDKNLPIPQFIYESPDKTFQVHLFIEGTLVDTIYPPGQPIPNDHLEKMADFYERIALLEVDVSNILASDWPQKGPPLTFFEKLLENSWVVYNDHLETHGDIYKFLELPKDPYSPFLIRASELSPRPWRLIHADIHRANMIEKENGDLYIIDWELALYGDLLYCISSHIHRCRFITEDRAQAAQKIYEKLPKDFQKNFMKDLSFYLDYEALSSIISDSVRFPKLLKKKKIPITTMHELCVYYADNLNRLSKLLGTKTTSPEQALSWFTKWGG